MRRAARLGLTIVLAATLVGCARAQTQRAQVYTEPESTIPKPPMVLVYGFALNSDFVARDDETLEIRPVTVASSNRDRAVLTAGLSPGEMVVTSPVRDAGNGMKIKAVEQANLSDSGDELASVAE